MDKTVDSKVNEQDGTAVNVATTAVVQSEVHLPDLKRAGSIELPLIIVLSTNKPAAQILNAYGADTRCLALLKVNRTLLKVATQAHAHVLLPREVLWLAAFQQLQDDIERIVQSADHPRYRTDLCSPVHDDQLPGFCQCLSYISWLSKSPNRTALDRMVTAVVITSTANNLIISDVITNGIRQCYKSIVSQAKNRWRSIAEAAPIETESVNALLATHNSGVTREFLDELNKLFSLEIPPPPSGEHEAVSGVRASAPGADLGNQDEQNRKPTRKGNTDKGTPQTGEDKKPLEIVAPSIRSMVRAAQVVSLSTKAGVTYQWDHLSPKALPTLTKKLASMVDHENDKISAFATLALASLQVRTNAKSALLTPTEFSDQGLRGDLWIDISRERLIWLHKAYMKVAHPNDSHMGQSDHEFENGIPLFPSLIRGLKRHLRHAGPKPSLQGILGAPFGDAGINLTEFNNFLRGLGDPAHVAEPTRFAHSLGPVFLDVTGSDMLAAFAALAFEIAAPSALYYFSPRQNWVDEQCTKVYTHLGL